MILHTERLTMRRWAPGDEQAMNLYCRDPEGRAAGGLAAAQEPGGEPGDRGDAHGLPGGLRHLP